MATVNKRINISLSKGVRSILYRLAVRDAVPRATKARHLLEQALEWEEDMVWDAVASEREQNERHFVSHQAAWR